MQLIGHLDSPYVRRVAVAAQYLGIEIEHRFLSVFRDYDEFRAVHPLVKVPTLITDDGNAMVDSGLIIDYMKSVSGNSLQPAADADRQQSMRYSGEALVAMEKGAAMIYETVVRPAEKIHEPWKARLEEQLLGALQLLESRAADKQVPMHDSGICQADIDIAIAWSFIRLKDFDAVDESAYPALNAFAASAEALPEFIACSP